MKSSLQIRPHASKHRRFSVSDWRRRKALLQKHKHTHSCILRFLSLTHTHTQTHKHTHAQAKKKDCRWKFWLIFDFRPGKQILQTFVMFCKQPSLSFSKEMAYSYLSMCAHPSPLLLPGIINEVSLITFALIYGAIVLRCSAVITYMSNFIIPL